MIVISTRSSKSQEGEASCQACCTSAEKDCDPECLGHDGVVRTNKENPKRKRGGEQEQGTLHAGSSLTGLSVAIV
jgi:hypothetical protein